MRAIMQREFKEYIYSLRGIAFAVLFLIVSGISYIRFCFGGASFLFSDIYNEISKALVLLCPILMMVYSIRTKGKTNPDILLFSSPVSTSSIIIARFFAAWLYYEIVLVSTVICIPLISYYRTIAAGDVFINYLTLSLLGAVLIAVCQFFASICSSRFTMYVSGASVLFVFYVFSNTELLIPDGASSYILKMFSVFNAYQELASGIFSFSAVIRLLSMVFLFLFVSRMATEMRFRTGRSI